MTTPFNQHHVTALRSAVDLLTDSVSPDYAETVLADYKHGGTRFELARSLYGLIDAMQRNDATYTTTA